MELGSVPDNQSKCLFIQKEKTAIFKIVGALRFNNSGGLSSKIESLKSNKEIDEIIVDMSDTEFVDSTVLGLIAQLAKLGLNKQPIIIYKNDNIYKTLKHVGFHKIFVIDKVGAGPRAGLENFEDLSKTKPDSEEDLRKRIENAHRLLCEIDEKNQVEFGEVLKCFFRKNNC